MPTCVVLLIFIAPGTFISQNTTLHLQKQKQNSLTEKYSGDFFRKGLLLVILGSFW